jgi:uncharacterized protein
VDPLLVLFGLGVGILVGMTGVGGGSLMTPLLILVFGVKPVLAVGTDLAYAAITKTVGGVRHWRAGSVDLGIAGWMAVGSIPGALFGVALLEWLNNRVGVDFDDLLLVLVGAAVLVTGLATVGRMFLFPAAVERERETVAMERRHKLGAIALGGSVGLVLGVTSAGSGALIAVGLIMLFRLTPVRVVGTDVVHAAGLLWAAALAHLATGNIDFGLMANLLLGSVPGIWIGSGLTTRVSVRVLRPALGGVLSASGVALLLKAGAYLELAVIGALAAAFLLAWWLKHPHGARPAHDLP